ncbi:MAG: hypothetical protein GY754_02825 [bacterium]|nr:hypothetical protein [bacterium]
MVVLGFVLVLILIVAAMEMSGVSFWLIYDPLSLLFINLPPLIMVLLGGFARDFARGWKGVMAPNGNRLSLKELKAAARVFDFLYKASIGIGIAGTLLGLFMMLLNIEDRSAIGPGAAIAILTTFWGLIIGLFLYLPIKIKLKNLASLAKENG